MLNAGNKLESREKNVPKQNNNITWRLKSIVGDLSRVEHLKKNNVCISNDKGLYDICSHKSGYSTNIYCRCFFNLLFVYVEIDKIIDYFLFQRSLGAKDFRFI